MHRPTIIKLGLYVQWYKKTKKVQFRSGNRRVGTRGVEMGTRATGMGMGMVMGMRQWEWGWDGDNVHPRVTPEVS